MATLVIAVILLTAITIIIFFSARISIMEQRIASNDYRGKQAFEAAEAGIEYAIARINEQTYFRMIPNGSEVQLFWEDGSSRTECSSSPSSPSPCRVSPSPESDATATVELSLPESNDLTTIKVRSVGLSDDETAVRTVTILVRLAALMGNPPPSAITARGDVNINGDVVINVPDIPNTYSIWAGGDAPCCPPPSGVQGEVIRNSRDLSEADPSELFRSFFQATKEGVRNHTKAHGNFFTGTDGPNYSAALNVAKRQVIWIDAEGTAVTIAGVEIGISSEPVILIIENFNNLTISDVDFYGLLYITGDEDNEINSVRVRGRIIGEDVISLEGPSTVEYDMDVINALDRIGQYAKVPGSWRDFEVEGE